MTRGRRRPAAPRRRLRPRIVVRDLRPGDLPSMPRWYRALEVHIARGHPRHLVVRLPPWYGATYAQSSLRAIRRKGGFALIAELDGAPVGFLTADVPTLPRSRIARAEVRANLPGYIADVFLEARARGLGVGRALFDEAERRLLALGCDNVQLGVAAGNTAARRFYARRGYEETSLRMRKDLAPPPKSWSEVPGRRARSLRRARAVRAKGS